MGIELGKTYSIFAKNKVKMDAVHIAVLLAKASRDLEPGEHVGVVKDGEYWVTSKAEKAIGIVDPFCQEGVAKGFLFYILIYPNTVMNMAHTWTLPCLSDKVAAKERFEAHAAKLGVSYEELMDAVHSANQYGDYVTQVDSESQRDYMYSIDIKSFWLDYSTLSGEKIEEFDHYVYSCSC